MSVFTFVKSHVQTTVVVGLLMCLAGVSMCDRAAASEAWWHVATISSPASAADSQDMVTVDVANVGDHATGGTVSGNMAEILVGESTHLVTVVDRLPTGVVPKEAHIAGGGTEFAKNQILAETELGRNLCTTSAQTVTCVYIPPVRAFEQVLVSIVVNTQAGLGRGTNEVAVTGGGAEPTSIRRALALEGPASFGVQSYELSAEEEGGATARLAGEHPFQLTTTLMLNTKTAQVIDESTKKKHAEVVPVALTKDLRFNLPPGLVGNPTAIPKCNPYVFLQQFSDGSKHCPNDTVIGVAAPMITAFTNAYAPDPVLSAVYNLEPSVGEPARFGLITVVGPTVVDVSVRTGGDYGVVVTVPNIPSSAPFIGSTLTLWGVPADKRHDNSRNLECLEDTTAQVLGGSEGSCPSGEAPRPFLNMPTTCGDPLQTSVQTDAWNEIGRFTEPFEYMFHDNAGELYGQVGCNRLSFDPSVSVIPDGPLASTPTGLNVDVHVAQDASEQPQGLAQSTVRDTTVALPIGVAVNPSGADGLLSCGMREIALNGAAEQTCPEAAKVGTVEIRSPLLPDPLLGSVYLGRQEENPFGSLIALYIVARDPISGVLVKLAGEVKPDLVTGQLVSSFKETPRLPFEDIKLHFFGGSRAPLGTPALCGSYITSAAIAPWSGNPTVEARSAPFFITGGPNGAPCPNQIGETSLSALPFKPSVTGGSINIQAGGFTPFTTTVSRQDGEQALQGVQLRMPPGVLGTLSGVELCPELRASQGTCSAGSLIGETTVSVGLGGNPYAVKGGRVYLTGPYEGAPFGLSIVNPAKAGPFDLRKGTACDCVVVRAKIEVDRNDTALTITTDNAGPYGIPTMIDGIPLKIQHVNVTITRPGFTFNPTSCGPKVIAGTLRSAEGGIAPVSVPFEVTDCATLSFKPGVSATTDGRTSRAKGASLDVELTYPNAPRGTQANIKSVKVDLPKRLPARLTTLQHACVDSTFSANPAACPSGSRVGEASAITPLVPVPLTGPAYFVSHGGARFPELVVVLQGYGITVDLRGETFISKANITSSTFRAVPDAPVGVFDLKLPQGPRSALGANGNLCSGVLKMPTVFTAQNGIAVRRVVHIKASGCRKLSAVGTRPRKN